MSAFHSSHHTIIVWHLLWSNKSLLCICVAVSDTAFVKFTFKMIESYFLYVNKELK